MLYKNNTDIQKKFKAIDTKLRELEERVKRHIREALEDEDGE